MILKPQDIVILLKLCISDSSSLSNLTYAELAEKLAISPSEIHNGIKRANAARLMLPNAFARRRLAITRPSTKNLEEFLVHGVKYAFPPKYGGLTRGVPTAYAAPPLNRVISAPNEPPPVWPDPEGDTRGYEFSPLYGSVPNAARKDPRLYEVLALVDAIRDGRARERAMAINMLRVRL